MKKIWWNWLFIGLGLAVVISLYWIFRGKHNNRICSDFEVKVVNKSPAFVDKPGIASHLRADSVLFIGRNWNDIDLTRIESSLLENDFIEQVDCYAGFDGILHMDITQKTAILRVIPDGKSGYYIDENGHSFPLSNKYTPRVLVATGPIHPGLHKKLYTFTMYVNQSTRWKPLVEQIFVDTNGDLIFTTRLGGHEVVIGDCTRLEQKFNKLDDFYNKVSKRQGWNKYKVINLKYRDQVICK